MRHHVADDENVSAITPSLPTLSHIDPSPGLPSLCFRMASVGRPPTPLKATLGRTKCLYAPFDMCCHLIGCAPGRDELPVDVEVDYTASFGESFQCVDSVYKVLWIEDLDAAIDEIGNDVNNVSIGVQEDTHARIVANTEHALVYRADCSTPHRGTHGQSVLQTEIIGELD